MKHHAQNLSPHSQSIVEQFLKLLTRILQQGVRTKEVSSRSKRRTAFSPSACKFGYTLTSPHEILDTMLPIYKLIANLPAPHKATVQQAAEQAVEQAAEQATEQAAE